MKLWQDGLTVRGHDVGDVAHAIAIGIGTHWPWPGVGVAVRVGVGVGVGPVGARRDDYRPR
ncbi:MAG: hypothetical protein IPO15_11145 [Anaerolineae bacterium]|uniref:hypothetical protein n=1 Tax=Candidatus Amarolinea dominans TaxID=3140696 RepID=UPI003136D593|nr:hypothetical protein [Anaerolineae bacterium]